MKAARCPAGSRAPSASQQPGPGGPAGAPAGPPRIFHERGTHRSYLDLAAESSAVPYARRFTRHTLTAWRLAPIARDAELVVSELVTNAVRATPATAQPRHVALYVAADHDRLTLLVWDASPQPPVRRVHEQDSAGGRGLKIVDELTDRWGTWTPVHNGKIVWAWFNLHRT